MISIESEFKNGAPDGNGIYDEKERVDISEEEAKSICKIKCRWENGQNIGPVLAIFENEDLFYGIFDKDWKDLAFGFIWTKNDEVFSAIMNKFGKISDKKEPES